jgi:hypothetical protein
MIEHKINALLQNQFLFLTNITANMNYLLELSQIQGQGREELLLKRQYINYIAKFAMDDYVLKIFKIIFEKDKYSFHKLLNTLESNKFFNKENKNELKQLKNTLIDIEKFALELKLDVLRDKFIAHHDWNRPEIKTDLYEMEKLADNVVEFYNQLHFLINNSTCDFSVNKNILKEVLQDNKLLLSFIQKEKSVKVN